MRDFFLNMDGLTFDDPSLNDGELKEEQSPRDAQQRAIDFSNVLIGLFADISEEEEISSDELRRVYLAAGANAPTDRDSVNLWALARVNMFVRMKSQQEVKIGSQQKQELENLKKITGLELEINEKQQYIEEEIDATENWIPSDEDFNLAESYIQKYNLDFSFSNIDDLYIEKYEPLKLDWE